MTKLIIISGVLLTAFLTVFYFDADEVTPELTPRPAVQAATQKEETSIAELPPVVDVVVAPPTEKLKKEPAQVVEIRNGIITIIGEPAPEVKTDVKEVTINLNLPSRPQDDLWVAANMPKVLSRNKQTANAGTSVLKVTKASLEQNENMAQATATPLLSSSADANTQKTARAFLGQSENLGQDIFIAPPMSSSDRAAADANILKIARASLGQNENLAKATMGSSANAIKVPKAVSPTTPKAVSPTTPKAVNPTTPKVASRVTVLTSTAQPSVAPEASIFTKAQVPATIKVNATPANGVPEQYGSSVPAFPPLPPNTLIKEDGTTNAQDATLEETTPSKPSTPIAGNKNAPAKPNYDKNGNYIEPDVEIDYGQWGEGYKNKGTSTAAARTPNDAEYLKWRNAQTYWGSTQ